jgi:hypothetical protein
LPPVTGFGTSEETAARWAELGFSDKCLMAGEGTDTEEEPVIAGGGTNEARLSEWISGLVGSTVDSAVFGISNSGPR